MALQIITLNAQGMRDDTTRRSIYRYMKDQKADIICLQECHVNNVLDQETWTKQWGGKAIWNSGKSNRCAGVGILFSPNTQWCHTNVVTDQNGRVISCDIYNKKDKFKLCNVYAQNRYGDRKKFIKELPIYLQGSNNTNMIICGDFNFVEDLVLDKKGGISSDGAAGKVEMESLCAQIQVSDRWRALNPTQRRYTWRNKQCTIQTRLDRFYCSQGIQIKGFTYLPVSFSDHDAVKMQMDSNIKKQQKGPGVWKMNISILEDCEFQQEYEEAFQFWCLLKPYFVNEREWWDEIKVKSKRLIIKHCCRKAKERRQQKDDLTRQIKDLTYILTQPNPSTTTAMDLARAKEKMNSLLKKEEEGAKVRARIQWIEKGEKPTAFFLKKEIRRGKKKIIEEIKNKDGDIVTSKEGIMEVFRDFYVDLFSEEEMDLECQEKLLDNIQNTLPSDVKAFLDTPLTEDEYQIALKDLSNNKTPGEDGLPKEFYYHFWPLIGKHVVHVLNEGLINQELTSSQRGGLITLINKPGDPLEVKNKRPISLLNVDYKILSRALTNRLKHVLQFVINKDQTCSVPGRKITDNLLDFRDIIEYINSHNSKAVFMSLDQEKAFDRVNHKYLDRVLQKMDFGPVFRSFVQTLYKKAYCKISVNGFLSDEIPFTRGVRQGCSLSPLLYIIALEPLACLIRNDEEIRGVKLPNGDEKKLSMYADDTNGILTTDNSIYKLFDDINIYEKGTGAKLNKGKTEALWLGQWRGRRDEPITIKRWTSTIIKLLGVYFGSGRVINVNWNDRVKKFKNALSKWDGNRLSFQGRTVVLNTLAAPCLWYIAPVFQMPTRYANEVEKAAFSFLWGGKSQQIKRDNLYLPKEQGGLGVVNIPVKATCMFALKFKELCKDDTIAWKVLGRYWLGLFLRRLGYVKWTNTIPHTVEWPPIQNSLKSLVESVNKMDTTYDWQTGELSKLYDLLTKRLIVKPKIVEQNPAREWKRLWQMVHNDMLPNFIKDLNWRIIHQIVKTKSLLKAWKYVADNKCEWPGCGNVETLTHTFFSCSKAEEVWCWVEGFLRKWLCPTFQIRKKYVLLEDPALVSGLSKQKEEIIAYIVSIVRHQLWVERCCMSFEKKQTAAKGTIVTLKQRLKDNINIDFQRLPRSEFVKKWRTNIHWFEIKQDNVCYRF